MDLRPEWESQSHHIAQSIRNNHGEDWAYGMGRTATRPRETPPMMRWKGGAPQRNRDDGTTSTSRRCGLRSTYVSLLPVLIHIRDCADLCRACAGQVVCVPAVRAHDMWWSSADKRSRTRVARECSVSSRVSWEASRLGLHSNLRSN